ncbi:act minimal PKS acyl carrier protein [Nocardia amikacinitolerans]|uniref:Act minimal PKS acyl carrier protein n=1 Tax=Nocardia amikacinitolerans TaxID=756689 RepID=A0A285L1I2_9NOCA|nr:acyl carrier protein [Nocardia amikacinitolerans]MCP2279465.1 act minimal PKS acyl carrier protein [Nocardia amikacinitolerans]MCP2296738.1 act minimal PKS acyl carrier protein [Nocardia amikacinitolerans]SNY78754.1 act minimal PKS acyl carrier protein [Nocardia amikacinitolerans]
MREFVLDDLSRLYRACEGVDLELTEKALDEPFSDLGLDSLGTIELAERIQREWHVRMPILLPNETVEILRTPRLALEYVNKLLATQDKQ